MVSLFFDGPNTRNMPNIYVCSVRVAGERGQLQDFKSNFIEGGVLTPERVVQLDPGDDPVLAYGASWMQLGVVVRDRRGVLELEIESASGPPNQFCLNASVVYPGLDFWVVYYEEGQEICGIFCSRGGEILTHQRKQLPYQVDGRQVELLPQEWHWVFSDTRERLSPTEEDRIVPANSFALPNLPDVTFAPALQAAEEGCSICVGGRDS